MASHNTKYRVFLSFRGPDVRKSLVDHLYLSLFTAGIHTFIDSEKLEKGHDIGLSLEEAIGNSDIYIPIFSTNYAYSPWCLEELSLMCSHISTFESNHKLIPLFYNVEPSDVRYPDTLSAYAKAFQKYSTQGRYNTDTINRWKDALNEASSLSGWSLMDTTYGYEGRLVKQVLMDLLKMLNSKSLDVAKHPVGLENRMNNLKDMLKTASNDNCVRTVGICGMGGIGKTTLSKAVFNEMKSMFDAACFVSEVRASAHQFQGLRDMQRQILRDLSKVEMELSSVDEGKAKMREYLGSVRALLILDDVDGRKQLEALYGDRWFGRGSRVIITTRDKHILNLAQADEIYETEELEHNQALELFSWHAFLRVCPDEGYEHLSERVVKACKGLPLSLEVMGAHLYDKKHETMFWDEALSRIESVMDKDLYETLKISFTSLHEEEKQIFLDISCFFLGEEREIAIGLWEALGCRNPRTAIVNLSLKSLITVDTNDDLLMHDHLRDLGREIVAEESRDDPYKRSRLWHPDHLCRVLGGREEIPNLRGFKSTNLRVNVPEESLALMKNFTFLWFKNVQLSKGRYTFQGKTRFPPKLKWLRLEHCSKLRGIFNMSHMDELKVLNVAFCEHFTEFQGLGALKSLTGLELRGCKDLEKLLNLPRALVEARIESCSGLKRISFNMPHMNELKVLNVLHCKRLTELQGLGSLKSLTELMLQYCGELVELPTLPRGLVKAGIESCSGLKRISFDMPHINELKFLKVVDCERLTELEGIGSLKSLTELMLQYCWELVELPTLPRGLVKARIGSCSRLKRISFNMSRMNELKVLNVFDCRTLTELQGLGSLKSLTELVLQDCRKLAELPTLPRGLVKVRIESCLALKRISFNMPHMNELKFLNVFDCERLTELEGLGSLKSLTELMLQYCGELAELPTLPRGLIKARIESCSGLKRISFNMPHMNELKVLNVLDCERLTELQGLGSLKSLTELMLQDCRELAELPTLPRGLFKAYIESCSGLKRISFNLSHMNELKLLNVFDCEGLTELQGLGALKCLTKLDLSHCANISELSGLESLESLTDLNLKGWKNVKSLAGMEVLKSLKRLIVNERSVSEINVQQWIQGLSGFQVLCLSANRIPKWLKRRMQTMPQPANGAFGKYCVLEDIKCTGIVFCLWMMGPNYGGLLRMNISTEEDTIYGEFPLPDLSSFDGNEQHVGILHEELPSIIKFRSGDIIGCSPATLGWGKVKMVGVHLQMDQNQSGNNEIVGTL